MKHASFAIGALVGAAVVAVVWLVASTGAVPPAPAGASPAPAAPDAAWREIVSRLDRIEALLPAPVAGRVPPEPDVETPVLEGLGVRSPREDTASGPRLNERDAEAIVEAMERVEARREEALSDAELETLARTRLYTEKDYLGAATTLRRLLERDLGRDERASALVQLGIATRSAGDRSGSAEVLEEAIDLVGLTEEQGSQAAFQLMWTLRYDGKHAEARQWGERVVATGVANRPTLVATHRALGVFAQEAGDVAAARQAYARALEVAGTDPATFQQRRELESRLQALDGAAPHDAR